MRQHTRVTLVLAVMLACGVATVPARADGAPHVALDDPRSEVRWNGSVPVGSVPDPAACTASTCEIVEIALAQPAARLVVATDTSATENTFDWLYDVGLYLYAPDGQLAASDPSSFESNVVTVDEAVAGVWRAVIVPDRVVGTLHYAGYAATTTRPAPADSERDLLPNLVAQPLTNLRFETAPAAGPPPIVWDFRGLATGPSSCYPQEIAELGARRCLRFDQTVANLGDGPLELRAQQLGDGPMDQRIFRGDGTWRDVPVGDVRFHLQHLHFHYQGYAQVQLYSVDGKGRRGNLVREGRKQGFCLADTHNMRFGEPEQTSPVYVDPLTCDGRNEAPVNSRVGLSPGWADRYPWFIPEQYIEVTGVRDGRYLIEFTVNGAGALQELRHDDNTSTVVFDLRGDSVTVVDNQRSSRSYCAIPS